MSDGQFVDLGEVVLNIKLSHLHGAVEGDHIRGATQGRPHRVHVEIGQEHAQLRVTALVQGISDTENRLEGLGLLVQQILCPY